MPQNNEALTPFEVELRRNIEEAKEKLKADGLTSVGLACLKQCTRTPVASEGAPSGTNAAWIYNLLFSQACGNPPDDAMIEL